MKKNKVLFICRKSDYHWGHRHPRSTTGLKTSAGMCSRTLVANGIESELVIVNDNNDIDREVTRYRPTHVIIEALWVVPQKFAILTALHPNVRWIIRMHSELPFMAHEGIATEWLSAYTKHPRVIVSGNSIRMCDNIQTITRKNTLYLPNCYIFDPIPNSQFSSGNSHYRLHAACFGAVRTLKNQLTQAVAAIDYANKIGHHLFFHVNGDRIETGGNPVLKNLKNLFEDRGHTLVLHDWMEHPDLLKLLKHMDIGMQVSFSESFNHMAADYVRSGLPMVVSPEVKWAHRTFWADPTSTLDIADTMHKAIRSGRWGVALSERSLRRHAGHAEDIWVDYFQ